jgi:hypothetical protein
MTNSNITINTWEQTGTEVFYYIYAPATDGVLLYDNQTVKGYQITIMNFTNDLLRIENKSGIFLTQNSNISLLSSNTAFNLRIGKIITLLCINLDFVVINFS